MPKLDSKTSKQSNKQPIKLQVVESEDIEHEENEKNEKSDSNSEIEENEEDIEETDEDEVEDEEDEEGEEEEKQNKKKNLKSVNTKNKSLLGSIKAIQNKKNLSGLDEIIKSEILSIESDKYGNVIIPKMTIEKLKDKIEKKEITKIIRAEQPNFDNVPKKSSASDIYEKYKSTDELLVNFLKSAKDMSLKNKSWKELSGTSCKTSKDKELQKLFIDINSRIKELLEEDNQLSIKLRNEIVQKSKKTTIGPEGHKRYWDSETASYKTTAPKASIPIS